MIAKLPLFGNSLDFSFIYLPVTLNPVPFSDPNFYYRLICNQISRFIFFQSYKKNIYCRFKATFNPIQTVGGLLSPYQTLKLNNFKTVKAMTTKFGDFFYNLSGNILKLIWRAHQHWRFHSNRFLTAMFFNICNFPFKAFLFRIFRLNQHLTRYLAFVCQIYDNWNVIKVCWYQFEKLS